MIQSYGRVGGLIPAPFSVSVKPQTTVAAPVSGSAVKPVFPVNERPGGIFQQAGQKLQELVAASGAQIMPQPAEALPGVDTSVQVGKPAMDWRPIGIGVGLLALVGVAAMAKKR